jgi:hypothetical protein
MNYQERWNEGGSYMSNDRSENRGGEKTDHYMGSMSGLFGSMFGLGTAMTKWTFEQMQTAMCMFTSPGKAMDRMKHTVDNFSEAMNKPVDQPSGGREEASWGDRTANSADDLTGTPGDAYAGRKA